jgi:hypothetical protein
VYSSSGTSVVPLKMLASTVLPHRFGPTTTILTRRSAMNSKTKKKQNKKKQKIKNGILKKSKEK